jgi:cyclophilin family peptidyl-prolyl cis-trans isomerase
MGKVLKLGVLLLVVSITMGLCAQAQPDAGAPQKAIIATTAGKINCTLFPDKAPKGVANFVGLAEGTKDWVDQKTGTRKHGVPLYDGTTFHRVIPEFMIQGGDPLGTGTGQPVPGFAVEAVKELKFDRPGRLAYANTGQPNSNGSQFFITEGLYPPGNGLYTIFGQCEEIDIVKRIARMPTRGETPVSPVKITHITIVRGAAK